MRICTCLRILLELALRLLQRVLHHVHDRRGRVLVDEVLFFWCCFVLFLLRARVCLLVSCYMCVWVFFLKLFFILFLKGGVIQIYV